VGKGAAPWEIFEAVGTSLEFSKFEQTQGQQHSKGRSSVPGPDSGKVRTHHLHMFRKTSTARTYSKMGIVAAAYLGGVPSLCVGIVIIFFVWAPSSYVKHA